MDGVNAILDQAREGRRTAQREEAALKEAITHLSHDIRTPLTSLDGYFQLLLQSPSAEEQQRYSAVIQSRIASLRDMLEELFTYARLQDKEAPLALEPVDFAACVYDTVFAFYEDFQAKGLTPQADFCDGHLWVQGNGEALRRTVQNLVKNALEHGGGRLPSPSSKGTALPASGVPTRWTARRRSTCTRCSAGFTRPTPPGPTPPPAWGWPSPRALRSGWGAPSGRRWRGTPFPSPWPFPWQARRRGRRSKAPGGPGRKRAAFPGEGFVERGLHPPVGGCTMAGYLPPGHRRLNLGGTAMIRVLLWDIDNTLLDFPAAERLALQAAFRDFALGPCPEDRVARYAALNAGYWRQLERGEITKAELLTQRFQVFFQQEGLPCQNGGL